MTVAKLVEYIKLNTNTGSPNKITLTDAQVQLSLEVALTRDFPHLLSLEEIDNSHVYSIVLLTKKEIYFFLAVKNAELYDIEAEDAKLKRDQVFTHFYRLISEIEKEYKDFIENGGAGGVGNTVTSAELILDNRYYSKRNYDLSNAPEVKFLTADLVGINMCEISWDYVCDHFYSCRVYVSLTPKIFDEYTREISPDAVLKHTFNDSHVTMARVTDLLPDTVYYVAVVVKSQTRLEGVYEITFKTLLE